MYELVYKDLGEFKFLMTMQTLMVVLFKRVITAMKQRVGLTLVSLRKQDINKRYK